MLQLHQLSTISIPLNDRSSRIQQGPPFLPSKYAFPELSLSDPLNSTFGSSIELNRFLLYCLDEFDTPAWEGDEIITAIFQAANVTHDNELTFTMFRSIFKLVNADMSDAQISNLFTEGSPGSSKMDFRSFQTLEKRFKFICDIPKMPMDGFEREFSYVEAGWTMIKDQIEEELPEIKRHFENGNIPEKEYTMVSLRVQDLNQRLKTRNDILTTWIAFLILVNDAMILSQHVRALTQAELEANGQDEEVSYPEFDT